MKTQKYLIPALCAGILIAPMAAQANCGAREHVITKLQRDYSETLVAGGLQGNRNVQTMVEVWASEKTGTFTMLLTSPEGVSCVVAVGTDFFSELSQHQPGELKG